MSCGKDAEKCTGTAGSHGTPEATATWAEGRGSAGHCDKCGGFLTDEDVCNNPQCGEVNRQIIDDEAEVWRQGLSDDNPDVRRVSLERLKQLETVTPRVMNDVRQVMNNEDEAPELRWIAIEALGRLGDESTRQTLEKNALENENVPMRQRAVEALGEIGDSQSLPVLESALKDTNSQVRQVAANAIDKINDPRINPQNITEVPREGVHYINDGQGGTVGVDMPTDADVPQSDASENRSAQATQHCPKCGAFVTPEGICRNDECGWIKSPEIIESAARQSTDPEQLDRLAKLKKYAEVRAAVAENPYTAPQTLAALATDKKTKVYQAAIKNPALPLEALEFAEKKAQADWQQSLQVIAKRISMSAMYYGAFSFFGGGRKQNSGEQMIAVAMLGVYGSIAYKPRRRLNSIRSEARRRRMAMSEQGDTLTDTTGTPIMTPMDSSGVSEVAQAFGLSPKEQDLFDDGLDIAESYIESGRDNYGADLKVEDVMRIRENGPRSDEDRLLLGGIIAEMEEAEKTLPGFFNTSPAEFQAFRDKLGCSKLNQAATAV